MNKLTSGRFIFTMITALVFAYSVGMDKLTPEQIIAIIMIVVAFYFNRTDRGIE